MIRALVKSHNFWIGVGVGALVVPVVMSRTMPGMKARLPGQTALV